MTREQFLSEAKEILRRFDGLVAGFIAAGGDCGSAAWRNLWRRREALRLQIAAVEGHGETPEEP